MSEDFREPTEQEAEAMFAKVLAGEVERQSYATFTTQNASPVNAEPLTLAKLEESMKRIEERFGKEPIDTHIFCREDKRDWLFTLFPSAKVEQNEDALLSMHMHGLIIWSDESVPTNEVQLGRIEWHVDESVSGELRKPKPFKVVTQTFKIA